MGETSALEMGDGEQRDRGAELAEFSSSLNGNQLPSGVREKLKQLLIDTVGVALGAQDEAHVQQSRAVAAAAGCAPQASILGDELRSSVLEAAFVNGVAAHGIDFDDTHKFVHPGCAVVPAVLALAENRNISGADFLAALAGGYEVSIRAAFAAGLAHRDKAFHPTGTVNVFGAAAGAGRAIGLFAERIAAAIGAASSMAAGTTQYRLDGAANKHLHGGLAARSGVLAALLAEQGFHGTAQALDGKLAFLNLYADGGEPNRLTDKLGTHWELLDTDFKPYPSCRQSHSPVDLALEAVSKNDVKPEMVERVTVSIYSYADKPWYTANTVPASPLEAFLSIPYCVASALIHGRVGLQEFEDHAIRSPAMADLIGRISVKADTALDTDWPQQRGARMQIDLKDGNTVVLKTHNPLGSTDKPMSDADVIAKFRGLAERRIEPRRQDEFLARVADLESAPTIGPMIRAVTINGT